jgi:hypothetical protein
MDLHRRFDDYIFSWYGVDKEGYLAALCSTGGRVIPKFYLDVPYHEITFGRQGLLRLPQLEREYPESADLITNSHLARRGLFTYVLRREKPLEESLCQGSYERALIPRQAIQVKDVDEKIFKMAKVVTLTQLCFSKETLISQEMLRRCGVRLLSDLYPDDYPPSPG